MTAGGKTRQPLSASWREWIASPNWKKREWHGEAWDAIVIGSGYGGSVAVLRLAQKGYRVLLLERGSEYLPGEFPNDFSLIPKFFRVNVPGQGLPAGRASGLIEVHLGQGMVAVTGNGLGGGSLVNAGVVMKPDHDVFAQRHWPAAIRHAPAAGLDPFFDKAARQLEARTWSSALPGGFTLHKSAALDRLAQGLQRQASPVDVTIDPAKCMRCGDCAAGCNVEGAKRSLGETYLKEALATGLVQVVTQAEVYRFEQHTNALYAHAGWRVHAFATDAQQHYAATQEVVRDWQAGATARTLSAPMLFVCAGTLGSTQLLQRSQAVAGEQLAFSPTLGTRLSGNGDSISAVSNEEECVNAVGRGARGFTAWKLAQRGKRYHPTHIVGPTITTKIDLRAPGPHDDAVSRAAGRLPMERRLVVEDAAIPRAIAQVFRELLATGATLKALDGWWFPRPRYATAHQEDPLAASDARAQHAQVLLVMGHDGSPGRVVWLQGLDRSAPYVPHPQDIPTYREQQKLFDRMGGRHVHNPLWQAMPANAVKMMSGPKPEPVITTVHPLGGCVMGDDPEHGVVNDLGQVWVHDPGRGFLNPDAMELPAGVPCSAAFRNEPRLYRGLYVLDGAIVPTSLGCNPLWTITALAERALEAIPDRPRPDPIRRIQGATRAPQLLPSKNVDFDARLHEVLIARDLALGGALGKALGGKAAARLEATFVCVDLPAHMASRRHEMKAEAKLLVGLDAPDAQAAVKYLTTTEGLFEPLPASTPSAGPLLFVRSMLELAALLGALAAAFATIPLGLATVAWWWVLLGSLLLVLPFGRTLVTWVVLRARRDLPERGFSRGAVLSLPGYLLALLKQLVHASEKRVMRYRIHFERDDSDSVARAWPQEVTLHASKTVMYRASIEEVARWSWRQWVGTPVRLRPTLWEQAMNAQVRIVTGKRPALARAFLAGTFAMGFDNLTSSGLSSSRRNARGAIELGHKGDTSTGLLALASYPLLFLRFALKTRLLDFRLPTYSGTPTPDRAPSSETRIRSHGRFEDAQLHWLDVERGRSSGDRGDESTMPLRLPLWRYRQRLGKDGTGAHRPADIVAGTWMGVPVARAKAVLLLHAFGQSGYAFTVKTVPENLAERFYREGYEVWVLEMRMSTRSGHASDPCCIDQIAEHDVPTAVRYILAQIGQERPTAQPLQIAAFAQCIGAAALWMALLLGKLSHGQAATTKLRGSHPRLSMLSHAMFSQVHPWVVGARGTQSKTWLPALLQALWRRGAIPFGVRGPQDGVFLPMLDRVLASLPAPAAEDRRPRGNDDAAATCRRIRYIEAPLFRHENIGDDTFAEMNLLFGDANLRLFAHARRFVDRERLVDEDGTNCYLTDENLRHHLAFPVQLLHGEDNELFDVESVKRSFDALGGFHGAWQQQFCVRRDRQVGPVVARGYGHLDVLIGDGAAGVVFPEVLHFFNEVLKNARHEVVDDKLVGWVARPPRLGPFVGWLREEGSARVLRVSFVVDDRDGLQPLSALPRIVLRARTATGMPFETVPESLSASIAWHAFDANVYEQDQLAPAYRLAWADIPVPGGAHAPEAWQVLTLHPSWVGVEGVKELLPRHPCDHEITAFVEAMEKLGRGRPIAPRLTEGAHATDFSGAEFRVTPASLRSLAAREDVQFAVASCRHPGFGIDSQRVNHTVRDFLAKRGEAAFAMLLGDQIYADATAGLIDPTSPLERFYERHEVAFGRHALGQLLAEMPVYMTPDDHEFTDGHPGGAPLVKERWPDWGGGRGFRDRLQRARTVADKAVTAFQRLQSPLGAQARQHYRFRHGCTRCYVFDTRAARMRNEPLIVDGEFLKPLEAWLSHSEARESLNVIACGTVVLPGLRSNADPANPGGTDTWQYAASQRLALLELLVRLVPGRFLLLSGDYHVSGAMRVLRDQQVVGCAVLAPPLYAPMAYANATPEAVDTGETIELPNGAGMLSLEVVAGGEVARGSGLGLLEVRRSGTGFTLAYERDLRIWEQGRDRRHFATLRLEG